MNVFGSLVTLGHTLHFRGCRYCTTDKGSLFAYCELRAQLNVYRSLCAAARTHPHDIAATARRALHAGTYYVAKAVPFPTMIFVIPLHNSVTGNTVTHNLFSLSEYNRSTFLS